MKYFKLKIHVGYLILEMNKINYLKLLMEHFHLILNFYYETFFSNFHSILFKFKLKNETKKRKITKERRLFNKKWTDDYFS